MSNQIGVLEENIADIIQNYQKELYGWEYDDEHVDTWVKQFPEEERKIVLTETKSLLEHNYMGKRRIKSFFDDIWDTPEIVGKNPIIANESIQYLNVQHQGNSQKRLLALIEKYFLKDKHIQINCNNSKKVNKYIYLDDCMYTGFTLLKDIDNWLASNEYNCNSELIIIFLGLYNGNYNYVSRKIEQKCSQKNIIVKFLRDIEYNNDIYNRNPPYDVIWSTYFNDDDYVNAFVEDMEEKKKLAGKGGISFRNMMYGEGESVLFTSTQNRIIFEKALLKKGAYICSLPSNRNEKMKPMGYSNGFSLGFGAFFATCYNISNNCPLAFWWGDYWRSESETLGKWYPLLPREVH